jgi:hypothetical protein
MEPKQFASSLSIDAALVAEAEHEVAAARQNLAEAIKAWERPFMASIRPRYCSPLRNVALTGLMLCSGQREAALITA